MKKMKWNQFLLAGLQLFADGDGGNGDDGADGGADNSSGAGGDDKKGSEPKGKEGEGNHQNRLYSRSDHLCMYCCLEVL